jgi:hypothetical protein
MLELLAWQDTGQKTSWGMLGGGVGQKKEQSEWGFKKHRWLLLVDDFVCRFNSHRVANVQPWEQICVDKLMSSWYGNGGRSGPEEE